MDNYISKRHLLQAMAITLLALFMIIPNSIVFAATPNEANAKKKTTAMMQSNATTLTSPNTFNAHSLEPNGIVVYKNKENKSWKLQKGGRLVVTFKVDSEFKTEGFVFGYIKNGVYRDRITYNPNSTTGDANGENIFQWVAPAAGLYSFYLKSLDTDTIKFKNLSIELLQIEKGKVAVMGQVETDSAGYNLFGQEGAVAIDLDKSVYVSAGYKTNTGKTVEMYKGTTKNIRFKFTPPNKELLYCWYYVKNLSSTPVHIVRGSMEY